MNVYELIYEDLTHLGGPMGSEYTTSKSMGLFASADAAKKAGSSDYFRRTAKRGTRRSFDWYSEGRDWRTDDLGFVMYWVKERAVGGA
jgi:hypothetical protein